MVAHVIILELAFTGLVADRAIGGVVDQLELHDVVLDLSDVGGIEQHLHPRLGRGFASGDQRRSPVLDAHQAHAAVAVGAKGRVVAEVGNFDAGGGDGVDEVLPRLHLDLDSVDE
jgi:hypothetical protein